MQSEFNIFLIPGNISAAVWPRYGGKEMFPQCLTSLQCNSKVTNLVSNLRQTETPRVRRKCQYRNRTCKNHQYSGINMSLSCHMWQSLNVVEWPISSINMSLLCYVWQSMLLEWPLSSINVSLSCHVWQSLNVRMTNKQYECVIVMSSLQSYVVRI